MTSPDGPKAIKRTASDPQSRFPFARLNADISLTGAFRISPKGRHSADEERSAERHSIATSCGIRETSISCPVRLVAPDEDVLVALMAVAASGIRRSIATRNDRACLCEIPLVDRAVAIAVDRSLLAEILGWGKNQASYRAIEHSLARLSETTLAIGPWSSKMIAFPEPPWGMLDPKTVWPPVWIPHSQRKSAAPEEPETPVWKAIGTVEILLCSKLTEIALEDRPQALFGTHVMEERRRLSPAARALYGQLVAVGFPGAKRRQQVDKLISRIYGAKVTPELRTAFAKLLPPIQKLGWNVSLEGRGKFAELVFKRPPIHQWSKKGTSNSKADPKR